MNKKALSLCIILFILIMCTTINAAEINSATNNTNTTANNKDTITVEKNINNDITDTTSKISLTTNLKTTATSNQAQTTQNTTDKEYLIKNNNVSSKELENVKTDTVQNTTGLNITGIITKAYDKENDVYAPSEEDGILTSGAIITLYDSTGNNISFTTSDNEGSYNFTNLNVGNYTLTFEYGTYQMGEISVSLTQSIVANHIFVPDIAIVAFSGDSNGNGQAYKISQLKQLSDRILFLESYELNNSYDKSGQWMLDYSNFILVDMFSIGNGFGVNTDLIAYSPASKNNKIAYVFGVYDQAIMITLANWGFLGGNPHSIENTYIGSYWQAINEGDTDKVTSNMENLLSYIEYLLGESDENPTLVGKGPMIVSNSWGIYYPGFEGNVKTPSSDLINQWILTDPGYNSDGAGSLNWMTKEYSEWNLENNDPEKILRDFEEWYSANKDLDGSFIVIATYYEGGTVVDALIEEYEKQGRAAFSLYKATSEQPDMTRLLEIAGDKSVITRGVVAVSYMYWWTTGYASRGGDYTINAYKHLNVSLINALKDISKFSYESEYGPQNEWTAAVSMPEFEGVYGALPVSYINENKETVIIPEGIAKHVQLTNGWAKLKELNNSDKKVSILLYGYPPGKANIGASYLDVFQSLHDMLEVLYDNGYDIGMEKSEIPTTEELNAIVTDFGNKGLWAEGLLELYVIQNYEELVENGQLVSKETYYQWYNELPESLQEHVTASWGTGLGNGSMIYREITEVNIEDAYTWLGKLSESVQDQFKLYWELSKDSIIISNTSETVVLNKTRFYKWLFDLPSDLQTEFNDSVGLQLLDDTNYRDEGYFLIPGKYFGNIFISVQPMRGWESQMDFHTSDLSPPQQYIAYYKYLSQIAQMNAIIHMGTHGTLEWLPGRTLGLQSTDWPFQLTDTPIIYPYIVSNPGEGMTAKERSFAQVITHMTPVTSSTSLYGDYVELNDAISRYDTNKKNGVEDNLLYYKALILNLTENLGYDSPDYVTVSHYLDDYKIALNNENETEIDETKAKFIQKATILGFEISTYDSFDEMLTDVEEYLNSDEAFDEWLAIIHEDLEEMSADSINYGMHTLGKVWNDTDMITGVISIASSRTSVLDDIMKLYYPTITESYYDKIKERDFADKQNVISGVLKNIVTNIVEGEDITEIANKYGVFDETSDFYQDLIEINDTIINIINNLEWSSIITALSGGYVEPGLSADPLYSDVLPTGRAMYASDTTKIPSQSAWQSAVNSIDLTLIKYITDLGEESFPELVGEVIWGTEVLRTEGISLAQFLYLLGVKPVWDKTGTVTGTEVIPLEDLKVVIDGTVYQRPRIDVFSTIVSNNPDWISLLTEAVEKVNALDESFNDNYVKKHYNETQSLERLFGLPGAVLEGTGVSDLLNNAGTKLSESSDIADELASVYEARIGHSWNVDDSGNIVVKDDNQAFSYLLEHIDLLIQNLDSTWRYLDSDDYVDWFGGLVNAANVHGNVLNTILLDIRNKNNIVTSTLGEEVKKETRTTILNPQWLQGMTGDVGGWNQMSMNFENLMKTMLTTQGYKENQAGKAVLDTSEGNNAGIVGDGLLREVAKTVTYSEYFTIDAQYKSYAFQSMAGWLLTSDMAGYWKTNDNTLRKDLLQKYVDNANRYGVACCHHTCGNINFHEWIIKTGASLGVSGLSEYSKIYASATKNPNAVYSESATSGNVAPSTDGTGTVDIGEGISEYLNDGATGEANAMAMAAAGATGYRDSSSAVGNAATMTAQNNGGTGSGANSDSTSGNGTGGEAGESGSGSQSSSGEGSGSGDATNTDSGSEGSGTNGTSTSDSTETQETTEQNSTQQEEIADIVIPDETQNTTQQEEITDVTTPTEDAEQKQNTTVTTGDTGAGDQAVSESNPAQITLESSTASSGGESGSTSGSVAMYEVVKKNIGTPPSPQSEIAFGYLVFVGILLLFFFIGFRRPGVRDNK